MGVKESNIIKEIQLKFSKLHWRLFRNQTGTAWQGQVVKQGNREIVVLKNPRYITFGLTKGSSDLIGWRPVVVTQEMVGTTIAQFTAVEVKSGELRLTDEQKQFLQVVNTMGGYGIKAGSTEDLA